MYSNEKRVAGKANVGDKVRYFDMANQNGVVYDVMFSPEDASNEALWGKGNVEYMLHNKEAGFKWSDLRQYGWSFVSEVNA